MSMNDFTIDKFVGKGSYGSVYKVKRKSDRKTYAIKEVNIKYMSHREREEAVNEIRLLASVSHPNIVAYCDSFIDKEKLCIVTEYCSGGDVFAAIQAKKKSGKRFSEDRVWSYSIQLFLAIRVLHNQNILHRDLKSPNVFIASDGSLKLGDLGVAKLMKAAMTRTQIGTPYYLSPEIWKNEHYNEKSDIWSLGVLLYEIMALTHPFDADNQKALANKVMRGRYAPLSNSYSSELKNLVKMLLSVDPRSRPSVNQILAMPGVERRMNLVSRNQAVLSRPSQKKKVIGTIRVGQGRGAMDDLSNKLPKAMYTSPAKLGVPKQEARHSSKSSEGARKERQRGHSARARSPGKAARPGHGRPGAARFPHISQQSSPGRLQKGQRPGVPQRLLDRNGQAVRSPSKNFPKLQEHTNKENVQQHNHHQHNYRGREKAPVRGGRPPVQMYQKRRAGVFEC